MSRLTVPLRQFVLKVHSRCDLACDHCYIYQGADQSWHRQPMTMTDATVIWIARRIADHARTHRLPGVQVVLHGGEPLLAGQARLQLIAGTLRSALIGICDLDLRIHTNGVLLDEGFCELFAACGVKVGISIDGDQSANDRHRRYADGRSSYDQVLRAIGRLRTPRYRDLYAGLLCTIDVANDPVAVYESLLELQPPRLDFLLPHATWDQPPVRPPGAATAYADWMIAIFDRWLADGRPVQIRTFDSIIQTEEGGGNLTEALGLGPSDLVVIETDGHYEQADSLKTAFDGAPAIGLDVFSHSLDAVSRHPGILARQQGLAGLCATCQACPVVTSCGGGLYAHRYLEGSGFDNPSVYCADLLKLISHVRRAIRPARSASTGPAHAVPAVEFQALATGRGGASAIRYLADAQSSLHRPLLRSVYQAASTATPGLVTPKLEAAWQLLTEIDRDSPQELSDLLAHPYIRVWAMRCLKAFRRLGGARDSFIPELTADLAHLGAIAGAAAVRTGVGVRVAVPVRRGAVHLPTLGRLVVDPGQAVSWAPPSGRPTMAMVEMTGDTVIVAVPGGRQWTLSRADLLAGTGGNQPGNSGWQPVRRLTAPGISVALEDTDLYRDCHQWTAAPRLTGPELASWQRGFRTAWGEIQSRHRAYAPALATGLRTLTPLFPAPPGRDVSATARQAFGAVAVALPDDHATLSLLLIHEFQHVKLGAVLDMYPLYDPADTRLFDAPWREDRRPLEGLLQGTYAHIAVTDFWRARQEADGPGAWAARAQFSRWHRHTADAIETLATSGSLTPLGEQFVSGMRDTIAPLLDPSELCSSPGSEG